MSVKWYLRNGLILDETYPQHGDIIINKNKQSAKVEIRENCNRCGGTGYYKYVSMGRNVKGICYKCLGQKYFYKNISIYTQSKLEKLNIAQEKRDTGKQKEFFKLQTQKQKDLYQNIKPHLSLFKKIFKLLEWEQHDLVCVVRSEKLLETMYYKIHQEGKFTEKQLNFLKKLSEDRETEIKKQKQAIYIGKKGDKIEEEVTVVFNTSVPTNYGIIYITNMENKDGVVFVVKSSSFSAKKDDKFILKGTIKAHEEYKGIKQNILIRCKQIKEEK